MNASKPVLKSGPYTFKIRKNRNNEFFTLTQVSSWGVRIERGNMYKTREEAEEYALNQLKAVKKVA